MAHPGHETLLHHWLETERPTVFALTDGSGGAGRSRLDCSRELIEGAGASCGGAFGWAPDRLWYQAVLNHHAAPFLDALASIEAECAACDVATLVCDPVELFNPIHDLANALTHALAARLERRYGRSVGVSIYPIEDASRFRRDARRLPLDTAAAARKRAAIRRYTPLAHEYPRYENLATQDHEILAPDAPAFAWPPVLQEVPYYERFGQARLAERRYDALITYADHVRPLALEILQAALVAA